jgi:hypothetical protein
MVDTQDSPSNPYNICMWHPSTECEDCSLPIHLKCRYNPSDLFHFLALFLTAAFPAIFGFFLGGYGWAIIGWLFFGIIFFGFWEIRILCSHCPYYAEEGSTLHCIANYGCPKFWKYHPEPISISEKIQFMIGVSILFGYPIAFSILGNQLILAFLSFWGCIIFFWTLRKFTCSHCVNFSCLLNTVPKKIVDDFLRRNPVMRKAWEEAGWEIGSNSS